MNRKTVLKTLRTILGLGLLVALALVLNTLFGGLRTAETDISPNSPTATDPTVDWKTYSNKQHAYSLKHPPNWKIRIEYGDREALILHGIEFAGPNSEAVWVEVWRNPSRFSLLKWFDEVPTEHPQYKPGTFRGAPLPQEPNSVVAGLPAIQILEEKTPQAPPYASTFFGKGDKVYQIGYIADGRLSKEIYHRILSSFKFIE